MAESDRNNIIIWYVLYLKLECNILSGYILCIVLNLMHLVMSLSSYVLLSWVMYVNGSIRVIIMCYFINSNFVHRSQIPAAMQSPWWEEFESSH